MAKYRRHQHALINSAVLDYATQNNSFRVRSESFGSSNTSGNNSSRGNRDRKGNNCYGDDLVELDFGTSFNKSPASSSLGSSESLQNRSRAGSTVQRSWSPKIEELLEENINSQSPSGRLIAKLFSPTRESPGDYVPMGPNVQSPCPSDNRSGSRHSAPISPTRVAAESPCQPPPTSGYVMMTSSSNVTSSASYPQLPGEETFLEQKIMAGVCPIQDDSVMTPRSNEESEEDPFCVVEIGSSGMRDAQGEKSSAFYENLIIPEVTVCRSQSSSDPHGSAGGQSSEKKDEWKVPSVNRPLVRPSSVALDRPDSAGFLSLSQSPRGRSSLSLSDRPAEKVMRSSSVSSTQPLPTGSLEKPIAGRMKSPLMKLFNSAMGRHSTDDLKSKATPPPSPSYTVMGAGKVGRESGQEVEPQRLTSVQPSRHSDNQESLESQLTSVLTDRNSVDGRLSNCAFTCRRVSSTVPPTIDYATLEFGSCTGEGPKSAGFVPTIVSAQCGTAGYSDSNATVYAQIDISKSEAIKKCLRH